VYCTVVPAAAGLLMLVGRDPAGLTILNVSFDPTRELWRAINARFADRYLRETGERVCVRQSHGGSASQARSVIDGLAADVVTLALWNDADVLRGYGLLAPDWEQRFPNRSLPYTSTIVFVVRQSNPKAIRDWPDLIRPGVEVITPNPKTSGNGKLSFLAAWGSVRRRGGSDADALAFVTELYRHVPILDTGARGATTTFAQNGRGDVHLTWESEAHLEVREAGGGLELVYPPASIRAEPPIAVVDRVVDARRSRAVAEAYLRFLYERPTQALIAEHDYRPIDDVVLRQFRSRFPAIDMFPITTVAADWADAQQRFFAAGGVFDRIYATMNRARGQ
jgi:sulfate transport system substrate-binding protein